MGRIENLLEKGAEADPKDNKGCKTNFFPRKFSKYFL
jgi:hypothetical protein